MDRLHQEVWNRCLMIIKDNVSPQSFRTWFEPIVPIKLERNVLTIEVPSHFFYEYLEEQFIDILRKTLRKELGSEAKLEYSVIMDNSMPAKDAVNSASNSVRYPQNKKPMPVGKPIYYPSGSEANNIKNPFVIPGIRKPQVDPQLNSNYTFETFIEGDCNSLARSAGYAIAKSPGKSPFNPLIVHGESGLGKTHLSQAIGLEIKEKFPDKIVLYVSADIFHTQFTDAAINNNRNDFLHFYQMIDVLILDDVQELINKEKTQRTFFHIFNHLHQSGKQLILTLDKAPKDLNGMERRLLSRFKWGLTTELKAPDYETRLTILRKKAYSEGMIIPSEILEYVATHITNNVRELEGALISIMAHTTLNKRQVNLELAIEIVDKLVERTKKEITIDYILKTVSAYFKIGVDVLQSKTRKREIVQARQIAMYFSKELTEASLGKVGKSIGNKDHATVLHACRTVRNLIETDKRFKLYIEEIERKLKGLSQ